MCVIIRLSVSESFKYVGRSAAEADVEKGFKPCSKHFVWAHCVKHPLLPLFTLLPSVAKFEEQQEQLMQLKQQLSDMEYLEKQLVSQKEEHEAAIDSLKKKAKLEWTK